jgi:dephospho-CoA kinase
VKKSFLIIIDGPIGAGKTTASNLLFEKMKNVSKLSLDNVKRLYSDFDLNEQNGHRLAAEVGATMTNVYLRKGINVIVEKAFTDGRNLKSFLEKIKTKNVKTFIYQIDAPLEIRIKRVREREKVGDRRKLPKEKIMKNHRNFTENKYLHAKVFDSSKLSSKQIVKEILKDIGVRK